MLSSMSHASTATCCWPPMIFSSSLLFSNRMVHPPLSSTFHCFMSTPRFVHGSSEIASAAAASCSGVGPGCSNVLQSSHQSPVQHPPQDSHCSQKASFLSGSYLQPQPTAV